MIIVLIVTMFLKIYNVIHIHNALLIMNMIL